MITSSENQRFADNGFRSRRRFCIRLLSPAQPRCNRTQILSMVLVLEIGTVDRFPTAPHLARARVYVDQLSSSGAAAPWVAGCEDQGRFATEVCEVCRKS
jgi:hypothetical protein